MSSVADPTLPQVFNRSTALQRGFTPKQVRLRLESGTWRRLRRGAYCRAEVWAEADDRLRHVLEARALVLVTPTPAWLSHASAAALLHLPTPRAPGPLCLTHLPPARLRLLDGVVVHAATLAQQDRWEVQDLPVTSTRRTVGDCLRHLPPADGLAVLDAALAGAQSLRADVSALLAGCARWPGARQAAALLELGDGRRESPLESWSFWEMHSRGLPLPQPQVLVHDHNGLFVGRVDFWWEAFNVVGEADGRVKYDVGADGDARRAQQALVAEKEREDRLRATGVTVVRWGARDLERPGVWAAWLRARLLEAQGQQFRGLALSS
ncbi:MAG: hypothetical protein ACLGIA_06605 [Actinomycetes bacterium]